jgi:hypothetical protein
VTVTALAYSLASLEARLDTWLVSRRLPPAPPNPYLHPDLTKETHRDDK